MNILGIRKHLEFYLLFHIPYTQCIDYYRRIMAAKQKKRSPTKKERDAAAKALRDRETLIKQLDALWSHFWASPSCNSYVFVVFREGEIPS